MQYQDRVYSAKNAQGLMTALASNYPPMDSQRALEIRWELLAKFAGQLQDAAAREQISFGFNPARQDQRVIAAVYGSRLRPVEWAGTWRRPMPLFLIRSDYEPFTSLTQPKGNIVWLDPSTEKTTLQSLLHAGILDSLKTS